VLQYRHDYPISAAPLCVGGTPQFIQVLTKAVKITVDRKPVDAVSLQLAPSSKPDSVRLPLWFASSIWAQSPSYRRARLRSLKRPDRLRFARPRGFFAGDSLLQHCGVPPHFDKAFELFSPPGMG
jgi:hypothetical protein